MSDDFILSDFYLKKIGRMIDCEDNDGIYQINQKFTSKLLDLGLIEEKSWREVWHSFGCSCSDFFVTDQGREVYAQWIKNEQK